MKKPKGFYRKKDKYGTIKTHPIFADEHHLHHHEEHARVYQVPQRSRRIIGFDVDGTLTCGEPAGKITLADLLRLKERGWVVAIISDATKRGKVQEAFENEADIYLTKPKAPAMTILGKGFHKRVYVGNSVSDEKASNKASWKYMTPEQFLEKVKT